MWENCSIFPIMLDGIAREYLRSFYRQRTTLIYFTFIFGKNPVTTCLILWWETFNIVKSVWHSSIKILFGALSNYCFWGSESQLYDEDVINKNHICLFFSFVDSNIFIHESISNFIQGQKIISLLVQNAPIFAESNAEWGPMTPYSAMTT